MSRIQWIGVCLFRTLQKWCHKQYNKVLVTTQDLVLSINNDITLHDIIIYCTVPSIKNFTTWWWPNWVKAETCCRLTKLHCTINKYSGFVRLIYVLLVRVFMCFVWISAQTAIISLCNINWLVCVTETECVYCAVRTEYIYIYFRFIFVLKV